MPQGRVRSQKAAKPWKTKTPATGGRRVVPFSSRYGNLGLNDHRDRVGVAVMMEMVQL